MRETAKYVVMLEAETASANSTHQSKALDCKGFNRAEIVIYASPAASASNKPAVLTLGEADDTTTTNTNITAFVGGGTGGFTIPNMEGTQSATTYLPYAVFDVDLRGRMRYLMLDITAANGQTAGTWTAIARLSKAITSKDGATAQNARVVVQG
jgi:hypothetical protein